MIVGNMVFMNFIIAVVNQSYEQCMSKMVAQQFKVKVDMIVERESMMSKRELERIDWFPSFIVLRRKANDNDSSNAWQGYVKEINQHMVKQVNQLHLNVKALIDTGS